MLAELRLQRVHAVLEGFLAFLVLLFADRLARGLRPDRRLIVTVVLLPFMTWGLALAGGWNAAALAFLLTTWSIIIRADTSHARRSSPPAKTRQKTPRGCCWSGARFDSASCFTALLGDEEHARLLVLPQSVKEPRRTTPFAQRTVTLRS